mgnify:CR=1 FL=1
MSRKLAAISEIAVHAITFFSSSRQKNKTLARVLKKLSEKSYASVACRNGRLKFNQLKSPHAASAVEHFFKDEPETLSWIDTFDEGQTFFDVGAGLGLYSLYAALNHSLEIVSFEPNGFNFGLLVEHIHLNDMSMNIRPFCVALGDKSEVENLMFNQVSEGAGGSSFQEAFYQRHKKEPLFSQAVLSFSLDDFIRTFGIRSPDHVKVDVDGLEPAIIAGAERTLDTVSSVMLEVEMENLENVNDLIEKPLARLGFEESYEFQGLGSGRNRLYRKQKKS